MDIPIQPMIGLRTHKGLLMLSRTMLHSGTIPTMMGLAITWNISMVKHGALPTVVMDARPPMDSRHLTDGAVQISMKMAGRTPHRTGSPVRVVQRMLGQKIQPNGMTVMVMAEGTTLPVQPLMFAHLSREPLLGQALEATVGVVPTQMVMVGRILVMLSSMNQHNGEIRMVTATVTKPMEMRQMHVQLSAELRFSIDWVAEIPMGMVGLTQPMAGTLIHTVQRMPSRLKPCNGRTAMVMDLVMYLSVLYEMTVPRSSERQRETCKGARTTTAMVGRMNMVNGMLLLPLWVKTLQHRG